MIRKKLVKEIEGLMKEYPAVLLLGTRRIGKTTLAKAVARKQPRKLIYLDLRKASDLQRFADPAFYLRLHRNAIVVIDEVQELPGIFPAIRKEIDAARRPGRFLLTASVTPGASTGMGTDMGNRMACKEISPLSITELKNSSSKGLHHWFRGGYPEALTPKDDRSFVRWSTQLVHLIRSVDLEHLCYTNRLSQSRNTPLLAGRLWQMLAYQSGDILNLQKLARALGVSGPTVRKHLDILAACFLVHRLEPWLPPTTKRLVRSPRIYLRDTGLLHSLCGIRKPSELPFNSIIASSWETYVVNEVLKVLPGELQAFFYCTQHGAAASLVLVKGKKPIWCIDITNSTEPFASKGFLQSINDLGTRRNRIIYQGSKTIRLPSGIQACSLTECIHTLMI